MKVYDVIPFGERKFLLHFWPVEGFLEQFDRGRYCETTCRIVLPGGYANSQQCCVHRPRRSRNYANMPIDSVYVVIKSDLSAKALYAAAYELTAVGREITEAEAMAMDWKYSP